jgi:hypothetical protein
MAIPPFDEWLEDAVSGLLLDLEDAWPEFNGVALSRPEQEADEAVPGVRDHVREGGVVERDPEGEADGFGEDFGDAVDELCEQLGARTLPG